MKFLLMTSLLAVISLVVVGCGSTQDLRYLDSRAAEKLEVPPDLTVTNLGFETKLPSSFSSDVDDSKPQKSIPVLLKVDSIQLKGRADFYWLSVDEPVDNLYQLVKGFWASEGFKIAIDEPAIGLLETDWVYKKEGADKSDANFLVKLFTSDDLTVTQNQFRTRVERDAQTGKSRIYIAHRGTSDEYVFQSTQSSDRKLKDRLPSSNTDWQLTPPNSEFEVEMLSRLMIYLGLQQAELDQQLDNIKLFSPLASIHADYSKNETYLLVKDSYSKTWYRTLHQLDRMNMKVVRSDIKVGVGFKTKGAIYVETKVEEIKESGFFSFGNETETVKKQITLIVSEESSNQITRISMETPRGEIENSDDGIEFLTLLYQNLK